MKKILIISVGAGGGHKAAAEALKAAGEFKYPEHTFRHLDFLEHATPVMRKSYVRSYSWMVKHIPQLWGYLYEKTEKKLPTKLEQEFLDWIGEMNTAHTIREIEKESPQAIILTHFLPGNLLYRKFKRHHHLDIPIYCVVTDHDVHSYWLQKNISRYFVSNQEVAFIMEYKGIEKRKIQVSGIPIHPKFSRLPTREEARRELDLTSNERVALVTSGGESTQAILRNATICLQGAPDVKFMVVAGSNRKVFAELTKLKNRYPNLIPFAFVRNMEILMRASDLIIAKSGGLTTSEALAVGLPMLIVSPIPGQEERNATYLIEHGAAIQAYGPGSLTYKLRSLLQNPKKLTQMSSAALAIAKPDAAVSIVDSVINELN